MDARALLDEITAYCRESGMAETTFGRRAVNDGKLVRRLRYGGGVTLDTAARVRGFIRQNRTGQNRAGQNRAERPPRAAAAPAPLRRAPAVAQAVSGSPTVKGDPEENFRFFDNRQKYLMFVHTCSEKWVVASRVAKELENIHPRPPAVRLFDAGVGDGTVLTRVMRALHRRFTRMPFYVVGKEISLEDVRLTLEKMPDRFQEHPGMVFVLTNMNYTEAPWLKPSSVNAAASLSWRSVALRGDSAAEFDDQITELQGWLAENWRASVSKKSGNPVYERPAVLVLYREDCQFLLDSVIPKPGAVRADYDLVIASQPYRARAPVEFKARRVIAPLARSLAPGGRLIGIHSCGGDPALEIVQKIWPEENPFTTTRHDLLDKVKEALGPEARDYSFTAGADAKSIFRYEMHTLPGEVEEASAIGTSTLFAAWNDAAYVAQIEDQRLGEAMATDAYLEATKDVLRKHGGLWFNDESYIISRRREI
jgi:SAM-dependent methyltransferase